jgi:hypothetical protein
MRNLIAKFWAWYERNYVLAVGFSTGLFLLQLIHLYWLTADVVAVRLGRESFFPVSALWQTLIVLVDYTEIPALLGVSLVYLDSLRKRFNRKSVLMLLFLNSQWLHILWITDEFVAAQFAGRSLAAFPLWLAWAAIAIDYLELPVIYDTLKTFFASLFRGELGFAKIKK